MTGERDGSGEHVHRPGGSDPTPGFADGGDDARSCVAGFADLANSTDELLHHIRQVAATDPLLHQTWGEGESSPLDELAAGVDLLAQRMKLLSSVNAAQALAWNQLHEAGGPDNRQAYAEFQVASELHATLVGDPLPDNNTDTGPG